MESLGVGLHCPTNVAIPHRSRPSRRGGRITSCRANRQSTELGVAYETLTPSPREGAEDANALRDFVIPCRSCADCLRSGSPGPMPAESTIMYCVGTDRAGRTNIRHRWTYRSGMNSATTKRRGRNSIPATSILLCSACVSQCLHKRHLAESALPLSLVAITDRPGTLASHH